MSRRGRLRRSHWIRAVALAVAILPALCFGPRPGLADVISFGEGDGLPSNHVGVLHEDANGEFWIASGHALARFDGARWSRYDASNSPLSPNDSVLAIASDHRGDLWIGTRDRGLMMLDSVRVQWRTFTGPAPIAPGTRVQAIIEDHANTLWVGTSAGIVALDSTRAIPHTFDQSNVPQMPSPDIRAILEDRRHVLWFTMALGFGSDPKLVLVLDSTRTRFSTVRLDPSGDFDECTGERGALEASDGRIWFVGVRRVCIYSPESGVSVCGALVPTPAGFPADLSGIAQGSNGDIWIGVPKGLEDEVFLAGGVARVREDTLLVKEIVTTVQGLAANDGVSVLTDSGGAVWVGTSGGLSRLDEGSTPRFTNYARAPNGASLNDVKDILVDREGQVWAGVHFMAVVVNTTTFTVVPEPSDGRIAEALLQDAKGFLWITWGFVGVNRTPRHSGDFSTSCGPGNARSLYQDHRGRIWMGLTADPNIQDAQPGAAFRDTALDCTSSNLVVVDSLRGIEVRDIIQDRSRNFWFATNQGVWRADTTLTRWTRFRGGASGPPSDDVRSLVFDASGALWAGTRDAGVARFDPVRLTWSRPFTTADGLGSNDVREILVARNGLLWFATASGLSRFDGSVWGTYTTLDGLVGNDIRGIAEDSAGAIWIGTAEGVSQLRRRPSQTVSPSHHPSRAAAAIIPYHGPFMKSPESVFLDARRV
jgi:ligand-binding sensor domain-containing protein